MKHPIIVMTGAMRGIAQVAAIDLAKLGVTLIFTARIRSGLRKQKIYQGVLSEICFLFW